MGRKKIEIKLIKNARQRRITFNKRRKGLIKKVQELAHLCGVEAKLEIVDLTGNKIFLHAGKVHLAKQNLKAMEVFDRESQHEIGKIQTKERLKCQVKIDQESLKAGECQPSIEIIEEPLIEQQKWRKEPSAVMKLNPVFVACQRIPQFFLPVRQTYFSPVFMNCQM